MFFTNMLVRKVLENSFFKEGLGYIRRKLVLGDFQETRKELKKNFLRLNEGIPGLRKYQLINAT